MRTRNWSVSRGGIVVLAAMLVSVLLAIFGTRGMAAIGLFVLIVCLFSIAMARFNVIGGPREVALPTDEDVAAHAETQRLLADSDDRDLTAEEAAHREALLEREAIRYQRRLQEPPSQ